MNAGISAINDEVKDASGFLQPLLTEINKVVVGQKYLIERLVVGMLADGHVLLEGVPGLAKTTSVKALANGLNVDFSRIQFTPDMLPADVIGTQIYNPQSGDFTTRRGPVFANIVLADEINRAPAKVQSALLEAMQEGQVTIGSESYPLSDPFLVLATQNPIEQEGTYPLPEAQVDRFMLKLRIDYPTRDEERQILDLMARTGSSPVAQPVVQGEQILKARKVINEIYIDDKVKDYIEDLGGVPETLLSIGMIGPIILSIIGIIPQLISGGLADMVGNLEQDTAMSIVNVGLFITLLGMALAGIKAHTKDPGL